MASQPRKNLLLIHLESVSQMAFWQYSAETPTLWALMQQSASFSRFFAASTSSVMSMADLLFGDSSLFDHLPAYPKAKLDLCARSSNLFGMLRDDGYATRGVQYASLDLGDAGNNFWGAWPDACGQFLWQNDREDMHRGVRDFFEKSRSAGQPFALYFWNMNTHLRDDDPLKSKVYRERFRDGYRLLDLSVARLLEDLSNLGMLDDTLIVAFGDHGDDMWKHGTYRGRSHIIDPYADVCWCPLFLRHKDVQAGISQQLVSMIDLKATLRHVLFPEKRPEPVTSQFAGSDILAVGRAAAFSQSMFALQLERSDPSRAITKSYAVTNGDYRVMASTGGRTYDDAGGMELYLEQWDYGDTRNLLDFCRLDAGGAIVHFGRPDAVHPHFCLTFTEKQVRHMVNSYESLRKLLHAFIKLKEKEALTRFQGETKHLFPDEVFTRARERLPR